MTKKLTALFLVLAIALALTGCGKKEASMPTDYMWEPDMDAALPAGYDNSYDYKADTSFSAGENRPEQYGLKMTYTARIELETKDYAACEQALLEAIRKAGGYVSSQESTGGYTANDYYNVRRTTIVAKVPAEQLSSFLEGASAYANVTSVSKSSQDITSQYVDTEARLESLEGQKKRLTELMEQAGSLTELLEVEERLSDVIYQIESYTAQMNTFKDMVAFSTVTVFVREVSTYTVHQDTFGERVWSAFKESWVDFAASAGEFLVGLIYALPFLLFLAGVLLLFVRGLRRRRAKKNAQRDNGTL